MRPNSLPHSVAPAGVLQRVCACGSHSHDEGACAECKKKREGILQRAASSHAHVHEVSPIVHEALRPPGQPLNAVTRASFEPRFGHDFSPVRVHTDARVAESARGRMRWPYIVGRDIVLGAGQQLLAHELTQVTQQSSPSDKALVSSFEDSHEHSAVQGSEA